MKGLKTLKKYRKYQRWIKKNTAKKIPYDFAFKPLMSIVIATDNTSPAFLRKTIKSVRKQDYTNWELCIADDASTSSATIKVLKRYTNHPKIKINFCKTSQGISKTTNEAIQLASGEFIAFLEHTALLAPNALSEIVQAINNKPLTKLIYSDEDKISAFGFRHEPHFKPDFNYDLLLSTNYICHLCVIKKEIVDKLGGFRVGFEGSQDYDLLLRCLSLVKEEEIVHVPQILYHRRMDKSSITKMNVAQSGFRALQEYLKQNHINAIVDEGIINTTYRIKYQLPENPPLVSLIIPTKDQAEVLKKCVQSIIEKTTYNHYEIIITNNQSVNEETFELFDHLKTLKTNIKIVDYDHPFNYSAMNNYIVNHHCQGDIIGLINNDIEVINSDWLSEMVSQALREEIGCVGAKLYYPNNTIQHGGVILGLGGVAGHAHKHFSDHSSGYFGRLVLTQNLSAVTAACLLVKKSIFLEVNGLNEDSLKVAFNDVDFCLKVRRLGYKNLWTPYARLYHHESLSRGIDDTPEKVTRFQKEIDYMKNTWKKELAYDPCYNPNLTLKAENFSWAD
ncbi:glycosyltransferase family 2 protein [Legionella cardiaca]|uniref:Glycosyltransferase n=1 Tax=Legionella cardiaca TaxID=1071983 RepID=A0ABY8AR33_9GAMM|nr:glycosyltransferase [Legionella cardiaca]WED42899.1 glycosyltransferase [Legionella cardiaca]